MIEEARQLFCFEGYARHNLVISHNKRIKINKELNNYYKTKEAVFLKIKPQKGQLCKAQSMWIWRGLELLGSTQSSKKGIRNNVMYVVEQINDDNIIMKKRGSEESITLSKEQVGAYLRLSYAVTYASVQGTEFSESLRLHDTNNSHFTKKHLFVAISRGKKKDLIDVA